MEGLIIKPESGSEPREMRHALPEWWHSAQERVRFEVRRILGPRGAAEDIAQDVALLALEQNRSFESEAHFLAWCIQRARWLALDHARITQRERNVFSRLYRTLQGTSQPATQEDEYFKKELSHELSVAISQLPAIQQRVCQLKFSGASTPEIGRVLNIDKGTVRSHFRHAKKRLVDALSQFDDELRPTKGDDASSTAS